MPTLKISNDLRDVIKKVVLDTYFPVGSLYLTVGNENPNNTIGGTWTKLSGYYLYADTSINNTSYTGKHTQSHILTKDEMPSHSHTQYGNTDFRESSGAVGYYGLLANVKQGYSYGNEQTINNGYGTYSSGGGQGHTHNIATKGIYVWQRTK